MTRPINEFLTNFEMLTNLTLKASSEFYTYLRKIVNRFIFGSKKKNNLGNLCVNHVTRRSAYELCRFTETSNC